MTIDSPLLVVIAGPTAVGKTNLSITLATHFKSEIISSDSRQFYREMIIGTAVPSEDELQAVRHHMIHHLSIHDSYDVCRYESDALKIIAELFRHHDITFLVGGSGLYINAVCDGMDELPDPNPELRAQLKALLARDGIQALQDKLMLSDPDFAGSSDFQNPIRLIRAIEIHQLTGIPASKIRTNPSGKRNFRILKIGLELPREVLYHRINQRVNEMLKQGLYEEAYALYRFRHLNALNTVGYKEFFDHFDGKCSLETAVEKIKTHSRRYAKRQMTWFKRDKNFTWFSPDDTEMIRKKIQEQF